MPGRLFDNFLHPPDLTVRQSHLDTVPMIWGIGQQIFHHTDGLFAGSLVLFEDDSDSLTGTNILAFAMRHIRK